MVPNVPPAYSVPPFRASAYTSRFAVGFQAVASPVVASSAAMRLRACPPMFLNCPATYTVAPFTANARTSRSAAGSQDVASPVVASRAAM